MKDKLLTIIRLALSYGVAICLAFYLADVYVGLKPIDSRGRISVQKSLARLDLYPYTGWHVQANYHHTGDIPGELQPYHDYDLQSGDLGFFGFKLQDSYPKSPDEFRIVLIGSSGAQGWSARTNDDMMYVRLPRYLNENLTHCNVKVTLYNMAMGASVSYQNFIALNRWGHPLNPDMILSYSGRNDLIVPFTNESDAIWFFPALGGLVLGNYPSEAHGLAKWLGNMLPNIMRSSNLGVGLRLGSDYSNYVQESIERYGKESHTWQRDLGDKAFFEKVVKADYYHALKSIKHDFDGVPMVIAWQAMRPAELNELSQRLGNNDFYGDWFADTQKNLQGYMNNNWYFINSYAYMNEHPQVNTGTHLGSAGQDVLSHYLADQLTPIIKTLRQVKCQ